jgi:hypothetical protein
MAHDQPTVVGRRQLQDVYSGALDAVAMDFTFTFDEVIVRGDTAVVRTRTDGKNTVPGPAPALCPRSCASPVSPANPLSVCSVCLCASRDSNPEPAD